MPTLVRWCEALRAAEVANWQQKHRVDWDATDGPSKQCGKFCWRWKDAITVQAKENRKRSHWCLMWLQGVGLQVGWAWATHFDFTRKILRVLCWYFEHQRRVQFERCVAESLPTITAIFPGLQAGQFSCGVHAVGLVPTERFILRRQMAAFMEASGLEVEEELSTLATQYWAEGAWIGKRHHEP